MILEEAGLTPESIKAICDKWGGLRLYVPLTATNDHRITRLIGIGEAQKLSAYAPMEQIDVPRLRRDSNPKDLHQQAAKLKKQSKSATAAAKELGICRRSVLRIWSAQHAAV